jgi:hypothetical protein
MQLEPVIRLYADRCEPEGSRHARREDVGAHGQSQTGFAGSLVNVLAYQTTISKSVRLRSARRTHGKAINVPRTALCPKAQSHAARPANDPIQKRPLSGSAFHSLPPALRTRFRAPWVSLGLPHPKRTSGAPEVVGGVLWQYGCAPSRDRRRGNLSECSRLAGLKCHGARHVFRK